MPRARCSRPRVHLYCCTQQRRTAHGGVRQRLIRRFSGAAGSGGHLLCSRGKGDAPHAHRLRIIPRQSSGLPGDQAGFQSSRCRSIQLESVCSRSREVRRLHRAPVRGPVAVRGDRSAKFLASVWDCEATNPVSGPTHGVAASRRVVRGTERNGHCSGQSRCWQHGLHTRSVAGVNCVRIGIRSHHAGEASV